MSKLDEQELKLLENAISKSEDIKNRYKLDDNLKIVKNQDNNQDNNINEERNKDI